MMLPELKSLMEATGQLAKRNLLEGRVRGDADKRTLLMT